MSKRKGWRLNEDTTTVKFEHEFQRLAQVSGQKTGVDDKGDKQAHGNMVLE